MVGASGWGAGRRLHVLPIAAALGAAGLAGFLVAQWAQRPKVETASGASTPSASHPVPAATAASTSLAPASVPPPAAPPATYLAPSLPAVRTAAPAAAPPISTQPRSAVPQPTPAAAEAPGAVQPTYTLNAVTEQGGQPVAIVNGQLVRVGDMVEGAEVVRIGAQEVELTKDGRRIVVSF